MNISFRQGLVRAPANFLQLNSDKVNLVLGPTDSLISTLADGSSDYLLTEKLSITNAWLGPFTSNVDYWLYMDISTTVGQRTFGHTLLEPIEAAVAPLSPAMDQHWFDTVSTTMKVWNGAAWVRKIRVFAAKLQQGTIFVSMSINSPSFIGTQVGQLASIPINAGALVYDGTGYPLKKGNGTYFTTTDSAITGIISPAHVQIGALVVDATAAANLAAFTVVQYTDFGEINVATNTLLANGLYGIIQEDVSLGQKTQITTSGLITNPAWDWSTAGVNALLFVNNVGQLTTTLQPSPIPVATVVDSTTIMLRPSSLFVTSPSDPATTTDLGAVQLSTAPVDAAHPIVVGTNDTRITAVTPHVSNAAIHVSVPQANLLASLIAGTSNLTVTSLTADIVKNTVQTLVDAATVNVNLQLGTQLILTGTDLIGSTRTVAAPTNMQAGTFVLIKFKQSATGSLDLVLDPVFVTGSLLPIFASQAANTVTMLMFWCDGTSLNLMSAVEL